MEKYESPDRSQFSEEDYPQIILLGSSAIFGKFAEPLVSVKIHSHDIDALRDAACHSVAGLLVTEAFSDTHFLQLGMENELIPKADVQAQVELLQGHLTELRKLVPGNKIYLIAEANMSCKSSVQGFVIPQPTP